MKSIFKAVATVTVFSIITRTLGFFFRILLSRSIGAEGIGLFQIASSILGIFMVLISSGIPLTTAKFVSKYEVNGELKKRNQIVGSSLIIAMITAIISGIIIYLLKSVWNIVLTDNRAVEILIILIPSVLFSAIYSVFRGALWGQNDYFNCGLTELLEQIIRFALTFIMLINVTDVFVATKYSAIAFNLTCLLSALITIFIYFKKGKISFKKGEYKSFFKSAAPVTGVRLANSLVQPLTTFIIPTMLVLIGYSTTDAVASFGVVMGMTFPMLYVPMAIIGSISMVLIPSISSMLSKNDYSSIEENISKSIEVSMFISVLFIPLYLSVGDLIGLVLYDNALSGILLQYSAICMMPITLCNLTGSILNALNMEVKSFKNYIIGSIVLFACLISLTPIININAIIVAEFMSMTVISILNIRKIKQAVPNLKLNITKTLTKYALIVFPCGLLGHFVSNICLTFLNNLFAGIIGGGISVLFTVILCNVFNLYKVKDMINIIAKKRKTKHT